MNSLPVALRYTGAGGRVSLPPCTIDTIVSSLYILHTKENAHTVKQKLLKIFLINKEIQNGSDTKEVR
jgi:hypothetical protein